MVTILHSTGTYAHWRFRRLCSRNAIPPLALVPRMSRVARLPPRHLVLPLADPPSLRELVDKRPGEEAVIYTNTAKRVRERTSATPPR